MHPLPESWVVYCVQWEDTGSAFPPPGPMRNRGTGDPVKMLGGHKGRREDEVKTSMPSLISGRNFGTILEEEGALIRSLIT